MQHDAFACTLCGCVCDDLGVTVADERIVKAERACALAEPWLLAMNQQQPPLATVDGQPVTLDVALDRAAAILRGSRSPLIFGLTKCGTEGQRAAIALADQIGATIDTSPAQLPAIMAMQEAGQSTCTLGEIKHRADLVIFWGADPVLTHPRLCERYAVDPVGQFLQAGRSARTVVVVHSSNAANKTAELADRVVHVDEGRDFEALWTLRSLATSTDRNVRAASDLSELAQLMKNCRYGVVFFGAELSRQGHCSVGALLRLVTELNGVTRFCALSLLGEGAGGADSVLAWQTGFPCSVNLARGYPRFNPGEFSAQQMLERGEADACLIVGSEVLAHFSAAALANLRSLPTVVLDAPSSQHEGQMTNDQGPTTIHITTAMPGIHVPGTVYRLDGVAIPVKAVLPSPYPDVAEVLRSLGRGSGFQS